MKTLQLRLWALLFLFSTTLSAIDRVVSLPASGSPWNPTVVGSFAKALDDAANGDTIIFDYTLLGASPTIIMDPAFANATAFSGVVIDALRGLPNGSDLIKFTMSGGQPNVNNGMLQVGSNVELIGIDISNSSGNAIYITGSNVVIDSCLFSGNQHQGIRITNLANNVTIKNSVIANNNLAGLTTPENAGIFSNGSNTVIDSCYIYGNGGSGVLISEASAANAIIRNSVIGRDRDGNEIGNAWNGIFVWGANGVLIENNIVVNNGKLTTNPSLVSGIRVQAATSGTIVNNFVGTDEAKANAGNGFDGVTLHTNASNIDVENNVICYNGFDNALNQAGGGLALRNIVSNINIRANYIGAHRDSTDGGNNDYGISIEGNANNTIGGATSADGNVIGFSKRDPSQGVGLGLWIVLAGANNNEVYNNLILQNAGAGIFIDRGANNNIVGAQNQGNVFQGNNYGVLVGENSTRNTLRFNAFSCNTTEGISLQNGGNNDYGNTPFVPASKSVIVNTAEKRTDFISGYVSSANAFVDIYAPDNVCPLACDNNASQGLQMITTVNAAASPSSNGLYFWEYDFVSAGNQVNKDNVVVLATENGSPGATNTSEFSVCANLCNKPENAVINADDLEICNGETTILTVNSTGKPNDEDYSYTWYSPSIDPANIVAYNVNDSVLTVNSGGVYVALISSQLDSVSCSDTSTFSTVVLNDLPNVSLTSSANQFCDEDSITLNAGLPTGDFNFNWLPNIGTTNEVVVNSGGSYKVIVTNNSTGCIDSNTVSVTRNDLPNINLTASVDVFCDEDSVTLNAGVTASGFSFSWSPNTEGSTNEVIVKDGGTFKVVVTNTATGCVDSSFVSIIKNNLPVPAPSAAFFCQGDSTLVSAGVAGLNYLWTPGNFTSESFYTSVEDTFYLTVTDAVTGCVQTDSVFADQSPDPKPIVTLPESDTICILRGDVIDVRAEVTSPTSGNLVWSNGVTNESVISVSDSIVYIATYTDGFGCIGADTIKVENVCILPDPLLPNIVTVNNPWTPFGEVDETQFVEGSLSIFNRWGTMVFESKDKLPEWDGKHKNGSDCSSGVYFFVWDYTDITGASYKHNGFMHLIMEQ